MSACAGRKLQRAGVTRQRSGKFSQNLSWLSDCVRLVIAQHSPERAFGTGLLMKLRRKTAARFGVSRMFGSAQPLPLEDLEENVEKVIAGERLVKVRATFFEPMLVERFPK